MHKINAEKIVEAAMDAARELHRDGVKGKLAEGWHALTLWPDGHIEKRSGASPSYGWHDGEKGHEWTYLSLDGGSGIDCECDWDELCKDDKDGYYAGLKRERDEHGYCDDCVESWLEALELDDIEDSLREWVGLPALRPPEDDIVHDAIRP